MLGFKKTRGAIDADIRTSDNPIGILDRMSWRNSKSGAIPFRSLPLIDQHILLAEAWRWKGHGPKIKEHGLIVFEDKMNKGDYQGALDIAERYFLMGDPVKMAARQMYQEKMHVKDYPAAEEIARKYSLLGEQYDHKMRKGDYNGAIEMAREYNLGGNRVKAAALRLYEDYVQGRNFGLAASLAKECCLHEQMLSAASKEYEELVKAGNCLGAARYAKAYGLEKLAKDAALRAYKESVWFAKFDEAGAIKEEFKVGLKEMQDIALDVCGSSIRLERSAKLVLAIAEEHGVADRIDAMALKICQEKVEAGEYDNAIRIAVDYGLKRQEELLTKLAGVLTNSIKDK